MRFLYHRVSDPRVDGIVGFWVCTCAGVALFVLATVGFLKEARSLVELLSGIGIAIGACTATILTGFLTTRMDARLRNQPIPWQSRIVEFAGYVGTACILVAGVWCLPLVPLERAGMFMGMLLILTVSLSATCLGTWSTLVRARQPVPVK
jgi:hypothetical protein